jgi:hypothetical protein
VQNTLIRVFPESILRSQILQMLYTAALRAKSKATPGLQPRAPLASGCSGGIATYSWGPIGVGLLVCLRARGTFITRRAVVQASGCDPTAVASRGDRRAQEAEEPVRRCAQRALHASRQRHGTVRHRFIDRCNLTKIPDSICNLTISSL